MAAWGLDDGYYNQCAACVLGGTCGAQGFREAGVILKA